MKAADATRGLFRLLSNIYDTGFFQKHYYFCINFGLEMQMFLVEIFLFSSGKRTLRYYSTPLITLLNSDIDNLIGKCFCYPFRAT